MIQKTIEKIWKDIEAELRSVSDEDYCEAMEEIGDRASDAYNAKSEEMEADEDDEEDEEDEED